MAVTKKKWVSPEIRRFGTFEAATQCEKKFGDSDNNTMMGLSIVCAS